MKIIIINGMPRSGKDTFVDYAKQGNYPVYNFSTIDFVKAKALELGWDGIKDERGRRFLSDIKDALSLYDDIPFKKVLNQIRQIKESDAVVFVHSREPKDISHWVELTGAKTLLIRRSAAEDVEHSNHADTKVFDYDYDYVYSNNGDLNQLHDEAIKFVNWLGQKDWQATVNF